MPSQLITVCAILHKDGKIFTARRAETKKFLPGKFELPGGHVEFGESLEVALKRELMEELDMEVEVHDPIFAFTYLDGENHVVEIDYLATLKNPEQSIVLHPEDHSEYRWMTPREFEDIWDKNDAEYVAVEAGFKRIDKVTP
jgi:8-oxo-dGTP diphosphatase